VHIFLAKEYRFILEADCKNDKTSNIKLDLVGESPFHLKGSFPGPEGTPYEGGHFEVVRLLIII
jgi:ubiquitin-protein ligase